MRSAVKGVGLSVTQMSFLWVLHKAARARGGAHFPWRDFQRLAATHPKRPLCAPAKASGVACSRGAELSKLWVHHKALCKREQRSARPHEAAASSGGITTKARAARARGDQVAAAA